MLEFFGRFRNILYWIQFSKIKDKVFINSAPQICSNLIEISSWPWFLFTLSDVIIFSTSSSLKLIVESHFSVLYITVVGKILSFTMGVHWEAKELSKKFAFSLKFVITVLPIISGGIKGMFVLLTVKSF